MLIDFWTYSCINCLRTLPYIKDWDERYRDERPDDRRRPHARVRVRARRSRTSARTPRSSGSAYPIALDNEFGTWNAWHNQYWPAKYLIDRNGHVRYYHFGEGEYDETEEAIRELLAERGTRLPAASGLADESPRGLVTPESYLGYQRLARYVGTTVVPDREQRVRAPAEARRERARLRRPLAGRGRAGGRGRRRAALRLALPRPRRLPGAHRARRRRRARRRQARAHRARRAATGSTRSSSGRAIADHLLELRFTPGRRRLRVHVRLGARIADVRRPQPTGTTGCRTGAAAAAGCSCRPSRSGSGTTSATTPPTRTAARSSGAPSTSASSTSTSRTTTGRRTARPRRTSAGCSARTSAPTATSS